MVLSNFPFKSAASLIRSTPGRLTVQRPFANSDSEEIGVMEFYSTDVGGLSLKVRKTEAGWEASIAGPASLMTLETAQRAAENMALAMLGREVSNITWKPHELVRP
jgi:hypothetical protein